MSNQSNLPTIQIIEMGLYASAITFVIITVIVDVIKNYIKAIKKSNRKMLRERKFCVLSSNV